MVTKTQRRNGTYIIALGANLPSPAGKPAETLRAALDVLGDSLFTVDKVSRFFVTPAFPDGSGPEYVNAAALLGGPPRAAEKLLAVLHGVEAQYGRARQQRWGHRSLDLDLLDAEGVVLPDRDTHDRWRTLPPDQQVARTPDRLILPHPRMADRGFVLIPLADIASDWRHPVTGLTVQEMLAALPEDRTAGIRPL